MSAALEQIQTNHPPPQIMVPELETKAISLPDEATALSVNSPEQLAAAGMMLTERIKPLLREADETFDPVIDAAHKAHKAALAGKHRVTEPLRKAEAILKGSVGHYLQKQERLRLIEQRRAQAIADEENRKALEAARLEAEARHAEEVEAQLNALPQDAPVELVREIAEQPAPQVEMPIYAPAPVVDRAAAPSGVSMRTTYAAEVTNIRALCDAVAKGAQPASLVMANMSALNKIASALKQGFNIPGCRAIAVNTVAARGR